MNGTTSQAFRQPPSPTEPVTAATSQAGPSGAPVMA
jgi:hypothetical protein